MMVGPLPVKINELIKIIQPKVDVQVRIREKTVYASDGRHGIAWTGKHGIKDGDYVKFNEGCLTIGSVPGRQWDVPKSRLIRVIVSSLGREHLEAIVEAATWSKRFVPDGDNVSNRVIFEIAPGRFAITGTDGRRMAKRNFAGKIKVVPQKPGKDKDEKVFIDTLTAMVSIDKRDGSPNFISMLKYMFGQLGPQSLNLIIYEDRVVFQAECSCGTVDYWAPAHVTYELMAPLLFSEERAMRTFRLKNLKDLVDAHDKAGATVKICFDGKTGKVFMGADEWGKGPAHEFPVCKVEALGPKTCRLSDFNPLYVVMRVTTDRPNTVIAFNARYLKYVTDMFKDNIIMHTDGTVAIFEPGVQKWF
jgi:hypothetical protein